MVAEEVCDAVAAMPCQQFEALAAATDRLTCIVYGVKITVRRNECGSIPYVKGSRGRRRGD